MSRRKCGDDADQALMPFVERIKPPGRVSATPDLSASKPTPRATATDRKAADPSPFPPPPHGQPRYEWGFIYRGLRFWFRSNDARSWYARLAEHGGRVLFFKVAVWLVALLAAMSAATPTSREPSDPNGWMPVIERGK